MTGLGVGVGVGMMTSLAEEVGTYPLIDGEEGGTNPPTDGVGAIISIVVSEYDTTSGGRGGILFVANVKRVEDKEGVSLTNTVFCVE